MNTAIDFISFDNGIEKSYDDELSTVYGWLKALYDSEFMDPNDAILIISCFQRPDNRITTLKDIETCYIHRIYWSIKLEAPNLYPASDVEKILKMLQKYYHDDS